MIGRFKLKLGEARQKILRFLPNSVQLDNTDAMFVSETNLFINQIKIHVMTDEGNLWTVEVEPEYSIDRLKHMALVHFYNPNEITKTATNYKFILISEARRLLDESTLEKEKIKDNDKLLLILRRIPPSSTDSAEIDVGAPTTEQINAATFNLQTVHRHVDCDITEPNANNFQTELRNIIISLVETSSRVLSLNPEATAILQKMQDKLEQRGHNDKVDQNLLKPMLEMGFTEHRAVKALQLKHMNATEALEWLLDHINDPEADILPSPSAAIKLKPLSSEPVANVSTILESFRELRRREFRPNAKALQNLQEMGFSKNEAIEALRIGGNQQDNACEWLLSDRTKKEEDDKGLDPESGIYKAIMSNPIIQLGLTNPKVFLAFLSVLEHPNNTHMWLNDPDAYPVLSQIFKTYHAEKHSIQNKHQK